MDRDFFLQVKPPKPLIMAQGEELLLKSLRSFPLMEGDNVYFVTQKLHNIRSVLSEKSLSAIHKLIFIG